MVTPVHWIPGLHMPDLKQLKNTLHKVLRSFPEVEAAFLYRRTLSQVDTDDRFSQYPRSRLPGSGPLHSARGTSGEFEWYNRTATGICSISVIDPENQTDIFSLCNLSPCLWMPESTATHQLFNSLNKKRINFPQTSEKSSFYYLWHSGRIQPKHPIR